MPIELPAPDPRPLEHSPLELVVCQVRFETLPRAAEPRFALAVQEALGGRDGPFSKMEPIQSQTLTVAAIPAGVQPFSTAAQSGWRLSAHDNRWVITLLPDQAALETTAYETWEGTFRDRLLLLFDAVTEYLEPTAIQRVGLRYVDRLKEPAVNAPTEWSRYIRSEVLGLITHDRLGPGVVASQQQVLLDADDLRATLRHGFVTEDEVESLSYLLDVDAYQEGFRVFVLDELKETVERLHTLCLSLFQQTVTDEMLRLLRGDDDSGS